MIAASNRGQRLPPAIPLTIAGAWLLAVAAQATGSAAFVHHDALLDGALPAWGAVALFVLSWQAMIAAMMLPSSLPLIRVFAAASQGQPAHRTAFAAMLAGYALIWTAFGLAAFAGDGVLHRAVEASPWLSAHAAIITSGVLTLAGAFQFSALKDKCLEKCRLPGLFLLQHYGRGVAAAFRLGRLHALFCVGCCWALMLVTFAAGYANLWWMAALTALMVYEKTGRHGKAVVRVAGAGFIALALVTALHPAAAVFGVR